MSKLKKVFVISLVIIVALVVSAIIYTGGKAFKMGSSSMEPLLYPSDFVFIEKDISGIQNHDIVVFRFPTEDKSNKLFNKSFVFRVVGLSGQTIEVKDKQLLVNGITQNEPFIQHADSNIIPKGQESRDNFGPIKILDGYVFVMGDNRDQAFDSRFWGPLPISNIKGKVTLVVSSKSGIHKIAQ